MGTHRAPAHVARRAPAHAATRTTGATARFGRGALTVATATVLAGTGAGTALADDARATIPGAPDSLLCGLFGSGGLLGSGCEDSSDTSNRDEPGRDDASDVDGLFADDGVRDREYAPERSDRATADTDGADRDAQGRSLAGSDPADPTTDRPADDGRSADDGVRPGGPGTGMAPADGSVSEPIRTIDLG